MSTVIDANNRSLTQSDDIFGYRVYRKVKLAESNSVFYELEHRATGARHVHISRRDLENTFSVAFKTVPADSTGVAHILEHTVLCGSAKYPVRDPFFSMLKRSLSTFMNAFTASDWTMYPFSTQNRKDFYNLMQVYLDAAFFPNLEELSFKQEGHRLEFESQTPSDATASHKLVYKGVVYNEMKGAMSSPDQVMARSILKALYPDTPYSHNSGGDPAVIPSLTYAQLKEFHHRHYHPSNAYFYTYGNLPLKDHLAVIHDTVLKKFERIDPGTDVPSQPRWHHPRLATFHYPFERAEDASKKSQVCLAWLTADIKDTFEVFTLSLLEQILLGNSASPLRKALIDSQLGTALCDGSGFDADNRDTMFVCGLKDVELSAASKIETIIVNTLKKLVSESIDEKLIESAIHQIEFRHKEITNSPYPYGIKMLLIFAGNWLHGGDPTKLLQFDTELKKLRKRLSTGLFFENQIEKYFLENPHRVLLSLAPDQQMAQDQENKVMAELKKVKKNLSASDIEKIDQDAEALRLQQESTGDVSCLPTLEREDIPPSVSTVAETATDGSLSTTVYDQSTSGIFYFVVAAGAGTLSLPMIPLAPFYCYALSRIGTDLRDYTDMARRIDTYTGGIGLSTHARIRYDGEGACLPFVSLNAKCLYRNQGRMFEIIQELLHHFDFSDLLRLKSLLMEYRAQLESMIVHNGHRLAISLASRKFSVTRALSEMWGGVHHLQAIKNLTENLDDEKLSAISRDLTTIGKTLFTRQNLQTAVIGESATLPAAKASIELIRNQFADANGDGFRAPAISVENGTIREGWSTTSAVSFVAQTFETVRMAHADAPALSVISKILRSMYLHREIREKGGAYGGFAIYNPEDGLFCFGSYRDPHVISTLNVYQQAADFIRSSSYGEVDVKEAVLQVCSEIDKPDPPGPAARKAFYRKIISLSDDMRGQFKSKLLCLTRKHIKQAAEAYFDPQAENHAVAVISGEEKLKAANQRLTGNPLELHHI
jgi:Zn-dependent M16 (insulinase) family peptidase